MKVVTKKFFVARRLGGLVDWWIGGLVAKK
jgi:hypothetical protein